MGPKLWIEDGINPQKISAAPRIGIDYSGDDTKLPWRFFLPQYFPNRP